MDEIKWPRSGGPFDLPRVFAPALFKVGKSGRPSTDAERDMAAAAGRLSRTRLRIYRCAGAAGMGRLGVQSLRHLGEIRCELDKRSLHVEIISRACELQTSLGVLAIFL
jgi:hypothetical protein